jgi:hypothetical protein
MQVGEARLSDAKQEKSEREKIPAIRKIPSRMRSWWRTDSLLRGRLGAPGTPQVTIVSRFQTVSRPTVSAASRRNQSNTGDLPEGSGAPLGTGTGQQRRKWSVCAPEVALQVSHGCA